MAGDDIPAGSYIDDERHIRQEDGTRDPYFRWVDEKGYVRLADGSFDDYIFVDVSGVVHDGNGMAIDVELGVPDGWSVLPEQVAGPADASWRVAADVETPPLSTTKPKDDTTNADLDAFNRRIIKTKGDDAAGHDLRWAGSDTDPLRDQMHSRPLGEEFVGEDTETTAFRAGTARAQMGQGDQWTTEYGASSSQTLHETVKPATVDEKKLVDPDGQPLNGQYCFVVDPKDGTLYTFTEGEMWVCVGQGWVNITGSPATTLAAALNAGHQISAVHHSSALSGAPAAGAGKIWVNDGKITQISNESGHYAPEAEYIWQTIEWLALAGMDVDKIQVSVIVKERNAQLILDAWKLSIGRGNAAQVDAKDRAMREIREDEMVRRLVAGSLQEKHYTATLRKGPDDLKPRGCLRLQVQSSGPGVFYCACDPDTDLPAEFGVVAGKGPQPY